MAEPRKPRGPDWRARLAAMPPIDWEALAIEQRARCGWTRKGDKRPVEVIERAWQIRKAKARKRSRRASEKRAREIREAKRLAKALG